MITLIKGAAAVEWLTISYATTAIQNGDFATGARAGWALLNLGATIAFHDFVS